jgi:hypothetical protein
MGSLMKVEQLMKWELAEEIEILGENLPQCQFVHHSSLRVADLERMYADYIEIAFSSLQL